MSSRSRENLAIARYYAQQVEDDCTRGLMLRMANRAAILNKRLPKRKGARMRALKQRAGVAVDPTGKYTAGWRGYNAPSMQTKKENNNA